MARRAELRIVVVASPVVDVVVVVLLGTVVEPLASFFGGHSPAAHGIHVDLLGKVVSYSALAVSR